jgi:hypothetical protein
VDARVNRALRDVVEGQLGKARQHSILEGHTFSADVDSREAREQAAFQRDLDHEKRWDAAKSETGALREELGAVKQHQAKVLEVVQDMAEEIADLRKTAPVQEIVDVSQAVQQLESKFSIWRAEVAVEVRSCAMRDRGENETLRLEAQAANAARADFEERLEAFTVDLTNITRSWQDFERRIEHSQQQLSDQMGTWSKEFSASLIKDIESHDQRLVKELRSEGSSEIQHLHDAVLALDEQLWLTDKRLGARVDELAQSRAYGECVDVREAVRKRNVPRGCSPRELQPVTSKALGGSPFEVSAAVAATLAETLGNNRLSNGDSHTSVTKESATEAIEYSLMAKGDTTIRSAHGDGPRWPNVSLVSDGDGNQSATSVGFDQTLPRKRGGGAWRGKLAIHPEPPGALLGRAAHFGSLPIPPLQGLTDA